FNRRQPDSGRVGNSFRGGDHCDHRDLFLHEGAGADPELARVRPLLRSGYQAWSANDAVCGSDAGQGSGGLMRYGPTLLSTLTFQHLDRPGIVMGGAPTLPDELRASLKAFPDAVLLSANEHGARLLGDRKSVV